MYPLSVTLTTSHSTEAGRFSHVISSNNNLVALSFTVISLLKTFQTDNPECLSNVTEAAKNPQALQTHKITFGFQLRNKNRTKSQRSHIVHGSFNRGTNTGCSLCPVFDRSRFAAKVKRADGYQI